MTEGSEFTRVGYISISQDGTWKVDYVSYSTGEATLQTGMGTQLGVLISGLEKNKSKYIEVEDEDQESQD